MDVTPNQRKVQFGEFSADLKTGELRRSGRPKSLFLAEQPLQVLQMLLEQPGEMVSRDDLIRTLWPAGGFGDFDHGLNKAVNKLRDVLGDAAESPKFIETVARRGYRFIARVTTGMATPVVGITNGMTESSLPPPGESDSPPSIAVLPFTNMSADPEHEFFADGITEEIINALTQIEELRVVARSSSFCRR